MTTETPPTQWVNVKPTNSKKFNLGPKVNFEVRVNGGHPVRYSLPEFTALAAGPLIVQMIGESVIEQIQHEINK